MDIFTSLQRTREEAVRKPLNYPEAEATEARLKADNERETQALQTYLRNLYAKMDAKVARCRLGCVGGAGSYAQVRACEEECGRGGPRLEQYVESRVAEMQELLGHCVANASALPNAMDETYFCYEKYNRGFARLKEFITEESMYYE